MVLGLLLLNALVVVIVAFTIHEDRLEHEGRARSTAETLSLLLSRDIGAVFDRSDIVLHSVVDEYERQLAAGGVQKIQLEKFLRQQQSHLPEVNSLRISDKNGLIRYGAALPAGKPVDISDREHFITLRDDAESGLVIGKPIKTRISHEWSIPLARRMNFPNGDFAGIVTVIIPTAYFVNKFSTLDLGPYGLVAMRSTEHISLARYPEMKEGGGAIGQFALSDQLRNHLKSNTERVTYTAPSPADKLERIFSYHKLQGYPIYVVAGLATQDVFREWWRDTSQIIAIVLLFSLSSIWFAWLLIRSWQRQLAFGEILRENEQRWSFALESGNFAVWDWDLQNGNIALSKRGKQLFGYNEQDIGNRMSEWAALCHPDDVDHVVAHLKDHFRGRADNFAAEFRVRCKDGSWRWIHSRGLVVKRASDGRPLRMIGLHSDINESKRHEEELLLSSTVFNLADEAMIVTDARNNILSVNPAFTVITGYTPEEVAGKNPRMLSAKTHTRDFYQALWAQLLATGSWSGEVLNRRKSGESYVEWLSIKRVVNSKGELTHHVAVFSDITARKAAESRMRYLALHDALTDLPNRTLLNERLQQSIVRSRRDQTRFGLMYFDLDRFKPVNDNYGHAVGDWLLKEVANRVLQCVRESDTVARLGGDEFVVLLAKLDNDKEALAVAEKVRAALCRPYHFAEAEFDISASIGVALYPMHGEDEKLLTRSADTAMYHAKKSGRNQVVLYQEGMQQE